MLTYCYFDTIVLSFHWVLCVLHLFRNHNKNLKGFSPWCEIFIEFCPAIAEILQHTDIKQIKCGKPKFREHFSPHDIAKSHLEHGTIVVI